MTYCHRDNPWVAVHKNHDLGIVGWWCQQWHISKTMVTFLWRWNCCIHGLFLWRVWFLVRYFTFYSIHHFYGQNLSAQPRGGRGLVFCPQNSISAFSRWHDPVCVIKPWSPALTGAVHGWVQSDWDENQHLQLWDRDSRSEKGRIPSREEGELLEEVLSGTGGSLWHLQ